MGKEDSSFVNLELLGVVSYTNYQQFKKGGILENF